MWLFNLLFSSLSQLWYVEARISRNVSVSPLEFEIMGVDCILMGSKATHLNIFRVRDRNFTLRFCPSHAFVLLQCIYRAPASDVAVCRVKVVVWRWPRKLSMVQRMQWRLLGANKPWGMFFLACVPNEDSIQPAHRHSLIRVFVVWLNFVSWLSKMCEWILVSW